MTGGARAAGAARQGAIAQRRGRELEKWVSDRLDALQQAHVVAYYQHSEPGWRKVGPTQYLRAEASGADFFGVLRRTPGCADPLPFAIECKAVAAGARLSYRGAFTHQTGKRKGLPKRQTLHLDAMVGANAPAWLAVGFYDDVGDWSRFLLPWACVPWQTLRDAMTLGVGDCPPGEEMTSVYMRESLGDP